MARPKLSDERLVLLTVRIPVAVKAALFRHGDVSGRVRRLLEASVGMDIPVPSEREGEALEGLVV